MPSLAELKELQNECLADDVDVPPEATAWTENEARAFFESGGTVRPGSEPAAPSGSSDASAEEDYMMIRWAVDTSAWEPGEDEWRVLLETLPEEDATRVMKFHFKDDQKRALVSRLLQRRACAGFLSCSHSEVTIHRTKGRKPYLATAPDGGAAGGGPAAGGVDAAPNWNFNVSHEGSFVILASEPALLCGVDVAAPGQLRRGRDRGLKELFHTMRDNFTEHEWQQVHSAGPADPPMEMTFRKLWSLKEAYTKARGDGLGFPFKRCEFTLGGTHPAAPARAAHTAGGAPPAVVETAAVAVDGEPRPEWKFYIQPLREDHWVSVARGPPTDAVDAHGGFVSTFRKPRLQPEELARGQAAAEPPFVNKRVEDLVPPAVAERLAAARTGAT